MHYWMEKCPDDLQHVLWSSEQVSEPHQHCVQVPTMGSLVALGWQPLFDRGAGTASATAIEDGKVEDGDKVACVQDVQGHPALPWRALGEANSMGTLEARCSAGQCEAQHLKHLVSECTISVRSICIVAACGSGSG